MVSLRRLHPEPAELSPEEAIADLELAGKAPADRPYVVGNMVSSADGRAVVDGRSGALGNDADKALFLNLRTQVDAVLVGTGTLRAERYGPIITSDERRGARERAGLEPAPLACVISRSLSLPLDIGLFQDPDSRIVLLTPSDADLAPCPAQVDVVRLEDEDGPAAALAHLRAEHGVRSVLCEGGPTLLGALVADGVLDELFLTISPSLAGGGSAPTILNAPAPLGELASLVLLRVLESEGALLLRYAVSGSAPAAFGA
ncbi:MAG TPA: dihydrofolate reductase family protein [Solirubrobacteraceae bacterium]|jgi:riboflavin biosynthesis pyrimidine reductase